MNTHTTQPQAKHLRQISELISAQSASDGDGVKLKRVFGGARPERFDPFLLLDEFGSDKADDYIGGFPPHPHRGFETITYMLKGKMEHRDHMDNVGLLSDGGVQWMTAGRGVIHSEMPQQTEGEMRGFQLWLNLPAVNKLQPARYEDVEADAIPSFAFEGVRGKAIAGENHLNGRAVQGYFDVADTEAHYLDIELAAGAEILIDTPLAHTALLYTYEGDVEILTNSETHSRVQSQQLARFTEGEAVRLVNTGDAPAQFLFLSGKPLREPIKQYGPFVMNTPEEIDQAIQDYRNGVLVEPVEAC